MGSKELLSSVFHFPAGIIIDSIDPSANELVIGIACKTPSMPCPECHQQRDLGAHGAQIRLYHAWLPAPDFHGAAPRAGAVLCSHDR